MHASRRSKAIGWLAACLVFGLMAAFPVASFYLFVATPYYYLYHRPFREVTIDRKFSMRWEVLPAHDFEGYSRPAERPVLLRFVENPQWGLVIDGGRMVAFQGKFGESIGVTFHIQGDRKRGHTRAEPTRIGTEAYHGPLTWRTICNDPCFYGPGLHPLDDAVCGGPCGDHGRPGLGWW